MSSSCEVLRFGQMSGNTQDGRRHNASTFASLHAMRYMLAVGPPMSEITPVKPGVLSRISSISRRIEPSDRFWMMRPSCPVIEQNVQPSKQQRMIVTENLIMSQAGILASPYDG